METQVFSTINAQMLLNTGHIFMPWSMVTVVRTGPGPLPFCPFSQSLMYPALKSPRELPGREVAGFWPCVLLQL